MLGDVFANAHGLKANAVGRHLWLDPLQMRREALSRPWVLERILKMIASRAGIDDGTANLISGHSLRVSAAQTLLRDGHDVLRLMKVDGRKSATTVYCYVEKAEIGVAQRRLAPSAAGNSCLIPEMTFGSRLIHLKVRKHRLSIISLAPDLGHICALPDNHRRSKTAARCPAFYNAPVSTNAISAASPR